MPENILLEAMSVFAAKVETVPGTAVALAAADGAYNVYNLKIDPNAEFKERAQQGGFARLASINQGFPGQATFSMDLLCGAVQPAWAGVLLAACGLGYSTGAYRVDSRPVGAAGSTQKTLTLGQYEHGRLKRLYGAMGNVVFRFPSAKSVTLDFTFTGIYDEVTDVAMIEPTYPTDAPLYFIDQDFTIGSWVPQIAELSLDLGNQVFLRPGQSATGYVHAAITNRLSKLTLDPEARLVSVYDLYGNWRDHVESAITWKCMSGDESAVFAATKAQAIRVSRAGREGVLVDQLEGQINSADLSITFDDDSTGSGSGSGA